MSRSTDANHRRPEAEAQHGCPSDSEHDRKLPEIDLLSPLAIRGETFRNRIVMSPMCQYCATEGLANDWHLVHLGSRAVGGVALVMVEATAVTRDGRISPGDLGSGTTVTSNRWPGSPGSSTAREPSPGIQLAHAGRKGSCDVPWKGGASLKTPAGRGLDGRRAQPDPLRRRRPGPCPARRGRDRGRDRRVRGRRPGAPWRPASG